MYIRLILQILACKVLLIFCIAGHAQSFQLPVGYFTPAKMPMHLVYPRSDAETQNHSRHRFAHTEMNYQIPIGVQGGAWPFKYEIVAAPSGVTIGNFYGSVDYGVINWPASSVAISGPGPHAFAVKVTDQGGATIDVTWSTTVDDSKFTFVQDSVGTSSGTGAIDDPLEDIADWYKNDEHDSSYHNQIVVFRDGLYLLDGDDSRNNNVRLNSQAKTPSLIAFPGEIPVVDSSQAKVITEGSFKDIFVAGIKWINGRQDVRNAHFWWAGGDVSRATWWRNHFDNLGPGTVGNDNTLAVFISDTSTLKSNVLYKENLHTKINNFGYNGGYFEAYVTQQVLIEQNIARDSQVASGWYAKGTVAFVSIRANEAYENVNGTQIGVGYGGEVRQVPHDHEVCWNRIRLNAASTATPSFLWAGSNYYQGQSYNSYIYRNTFVNGSAWLRFAGSEPYESEDNVVMSDLLTRWGPNEGNSSNSKNITGTTTSGITDNKGRLAGAFRSNYLGKKGFEIFANDNVLAPPSPPPGGVNIIVLPRTQ